MSATKPFQARFRTLVPVRQLNASAQDILFEAAEPRTVLEGQVVYSQHQEDDYAYYLIDGSVQLLSDGRPLRNISSNHRASLRPLDSHISKRHTAKALTRAVICRVPRSDMARLGADELGQSPVTLDIGDIAERDAANWMPRVLRSGLFASLPPREVQRVFDRMERREVAANDVICAQGETGRWFYLIERGYCEVVRESNGGSRPVHLADLGPGEYFGEEALIADAPRSAAVSMLTDGTVLRLPRDDFLELLARPLVEAVDFADASRAVAAGDAVWLDTRLPESVAVRPIPGALHVPYHLLRQKIGRLDRTPVYIIVGDDPGQARVDAFLLATRGFRARPLAAAGVPQPESGKSRHAAHHREEERFMPDDKLTITRLDRMYGEDEAEADIAASAPAESYTDTATGKSLADLIDEMHERREALSATLRTDGGGTTAAPVALHATHRPAELAPLTRIPTPPETTEPVDLEPLDIGADAAPASGTGPAASEDELADIVHEFEERLRAYFDRLTTEQSSELSAEYELRIEALKKAAGEKVREKAREVDEHYRRHYAEKEQTLRRHYKKLMGLAGKISQQKAQIQKAREEFEEKLDAANELHRQVAEMRETLRQHLGAIREDGEGDGRIAS